MSKRESIIEQAFVEQLEAHGWMQMKGSARRGFSDRFFFGYERRTVLVEFKREGARPGRRGEKLQDHYRNEFELHGFECHKIVTEDSAMKLSAKLCKDNEQAFIRQRNVSSW